MKDPFDVSDWNESKRHLLEKDIQGPSVTKARKAGWWARKFSSAPGNTAVPDYIFGKGGRIFFVEFKRPGGEATEKQSEEHKKMRAAGLTVYVCDTRERFDIILAMGRTEDFEMSWQKVGRFYIEDFANFPNNYFDLSIDNQFKVVFRELSSNDLHDLQYLISEAIRRNVAE